MDTEHATGSHTDMETSNPTHTEPSPRTVVDIHLASMQNEIKEDPDLMDTYTVVLIDNSIVQNSNVTSMLTTQDEECTNEAPPLQSQCSRVMSSGVDETVEEHNVSGTVLQSSTSSTESVQDIVASHTVHKSGSLCGKELNAVQQVVKKRGRPPKRSFIENELNIEPTIVIKHGSSPNRGFNESESEVVPKVVKKRGRPPKKKLLEPETSACDHSETTTSDSLNVNPISNGSSSLSKNQSKLMLNVNQICEKELMICLNDIAPVKKKKRAKTITVNKPKPKPSSKKTIKEIYKMKQVKTEMLSNEEELFEESREDSDSDEWEQDGEDSFSSEEEFKPKYSKKGKSNRKQKSKKGTNGQRIGRPPKMVKTYSCNSCSYITEVNTDFMEHKKTHVIWYYCDFCDFSTKSRDLFFEHDAKHTDNRYFKCEKCPSTFKNREDCRRHLECKHATEKLYKCPHCDHTTAWKRNMTHHIIMKHTDSRPHECSICGFAFKRAQDLRGHIRRHGSDKPVQCDQCNFRCKSNYELRCHKTSHSDYRPFKCEYPGCTQACKTKSDFTKHLKVHSDVRDFKCPICEKGFKTACMRNKHIARHTDERKFKCEFCQKGFKVMAGLRNHLRLHDGIKPFTCETCGWKFSSKSNMNVHLKTHTTGFRPYRCPVCPHAAKSKHNLLAHIGSVHGNSYAYFCELCKKPFKRYFSLQLHYTRMHTEEERERLKELAEFTVSVCENQVKTEQGDEDDDDEEYDSNYHQQDNEGGEETGLDVITRKIKEEPQSSGYGDTSHTSISYSQDSDNSVPVKRKRGRPRKEKNLKGNAAVQKKKKQRAKKGEKMTVDKNNEHGKAGRKVTRDKNEEQSIVNGNVIDDIDKEQNEIEEDSEVEGEVPYDKEQFEVEGELTNDKQQSVIQKELDSDVEHCIVEGDLTINREQCGNEGEETVDKAVEQCVFEGEVTDDKAQCVVEGDDDGDKEHCIVERVTSVNINEQNVLEEEVTGDKDVEQCVVEGEVTGDKALEQCVVEGEVTGDKAVEQCVVEGEVTGAKAVEQYVVEGEATCEKAVEQCVVEGEMNKNREQCIVKGEMNKDQAWCVIEGAVTDDNEQHVDGSKLTSEKQKDQGLVICEGGNSIASLTTEIACCDSDAPVSKSPCSRTSHQNSKVSLKETEAVEQHSKAQSKDLNVPSSHCIKESEDNPQFPGILTETTMPNSELVGQKSINSTRNVFESFSQLSQINATSKPPSSYSEVTKSAVCQIQKKSSAEPCVASSKKAKSNNAARGNLNVEPMNDSSNPPATLALYDDFRLPLATKGFEFNFEKTGKKPRSWFMDPELMNEDDRAHQLSYMWKTARKFNHNLKRRSGLRLAEPASVKKMSNLQKQIFSERLSDALHLDYSNSNKQRKKFSDTSYQRKQSLVPSTLSHEDLKDFTKKEGTLLKPKLEFVPMEEKNLQIQKVKTIRSRDRNLDISLKPIKLEPWEAPLNIPLEHSSGVSRKTSNASTTVDSESHPNVPSCSLSSQSISDAAEKNSSCTKGRYTKVAIAQRQTMKENTFQKQRQICLTKSAAKEIERLEKQKNQLYRLHKAITSTKVKGEGQTGTSEVDSDGSKLDLKQISSLDSELLELGGNPIFPKRKAKIIAKINNVTEAIKEQTYRKTKIEKHMKAKTLKMKIIKNFMKAKKLAKQLEEKEKLEKERIARMEEVVRVNLMKKSKIMAKHTQKNAMTGNHASKSVTKEKIVKVKTKTGKVKDSKSKIVSKKKMDVLMRKQKLASEILKKKLKEKIKKKIKDGKVDKTIGKKKTKVDKEKGKYSGGNKGMKTGKTVTKTSTSAKQNVVQKERKKLGKLGKLPKKTSEDKSKVIKVKSSLKRKRGESEEQGLQPNKTLAKKLKKGKQQKLIGSQNKVATSKKFKKMEEKESTAKKMKKTKQKESLNVKKKGVVMKSQGSQTFGEVKSLKKKQKRGTLQEKKVIHINSKKKFSPKKSQGSPTKFVKRKVKMSSPIKVSNLFHRSPRIELVTVAEEDRIAERHFNTAPHDFLHAERQTENYEIESEDLKPVPLLTNALRITGATTSLSHSSGSVILTAVPLLNAQPEVIVKQEMTSQEMTGPEMINQEMTGEHQVQSVSLTTEESVNRTVPFNLDVDCKSKLYETTSSHIDAKTGVSGMHSENESTLINYFDDIVMLQSEYNRVDGGTGCDASFTENNNSVPLCMIRNFADKNFVNPGQNIVATDHLGFVVKCDVNNETTVDGSDLDIGEETLQDNKSLPDNMCCLKGESVVNSEANVVGDYSVQSYPTPQNNVCIAGTDDNIDDQSCERDMGKDSVQSCSTPQNDICVIGTTGNIDDQPCDSQVRAEPVSISDNIDDQPCNSVMGDDSLQVYPTPQNNVCIIGTADNIDDQSCHSHVSAEPVSIGDNIDDQPSHSHVSVEPVSISESGYVVVKQEQDIEMNYEMLWKQNLKE